MVVHLLDELARELDGLDVRPERAAEDPSKRDSIFDSMVRSTLIQMGVTPASQSRGSIRRPRPWVRSQRWPVIKYIGSKRLLVPLIRRVAERLPVRTACDLFAGTTRVGQALRGLGLVVHSNDLATYSEALGQAYIAAGESVDRVRLAAILRELSALEGRDGYFTEAFCRQARYFQPHNGRRIDAIRDAIDGYDLSEVERGIVLTSLLEAADRVDSTTGLQMAYLKSWAPRSHERAGASPAGPRHRARRAPSAGWTRTCSPRSSTSTSSTSIRRTTSTRTSRTTTSGRRSSAGTPRALRHRQQAGRLPRAEEPLQLEAAGAGGAGRALRRAARALAARLGQRRGVPRHAGAPRAACRARVRRPDRHRGQAVRGCPDRHLQPGGREGRQRLAAAQPRAPVRRRARPRPRRGDRREAGVAMAA